MCVLERPCGLSHPVNCFLHAALKSCDPLSLPTPPPRRAVTRLPLFTGSNERKMFPSTLMTRRGSGRAQTKLITPSVSPRHYAEFSGDAEVYFHHNFDTQSPFNYRKCFCKVLSLAAGKQAFGDCRRSSQIVVVGAPVHEHDQRRTKRWGFSRSMLKSKELVAV